MDKRITSLSVLVAAGLFSGCGITLNAVETVSDSVQTITDITSSTSGALTGDDTAEQFVANNFDTLSAQAARGGGNAVDTLAELLDEPDGDEFARWLQMDYDQVFAEPETTLQRIVIGRQQLARSNR